MLDEPFTHLMPLHIEKLKGILKSEKAKKGFLITNHMYTHIVDVCDNAYALAAGKTYLAKKLNDLDTFGYANASRS